MDCDLQHPPETLISMYHLWEQGWEVIEGVKKSRGTESLLHKESAGFFYGIMSKATGVNMQNASDFKMMDRKAVNSILSMPERNMFSVRPHPGWDLRPLMWNLRCGTEKLDSLSGLPGP